MIFIKSLLKKVWSIICPALIIGTISILVFNFVAKPALIVGDSMEPNFHNGQLKFINMFDKKYERYDVVVIDSVAAKSTLIKRIIGLPGETVYISDGSIYINDQKIDDVTEVEMGYEGILSTPVTLGKGEYIVLGDNRANSEDSRVIGKVKKKEIVGKIFT